jgi:hypothetical protein
MLREGFASWYLKLPVISGRGHGSAVSPPVVRVDVGTLNGASAADTEYSDNL